MLVTTDNNCGSLVLHEKDTKELKQIANISIAELVKRDHRLLLFPESLAMSHDDIADACIFELAPCQSLAPVDRLAHQNTQSLTTNNIMGFIGVNDTQLKIQSRFAKETQSSTDDYFLHYMLEKVFCINLFDLQHSQKQSSLFDFLVYLFPYFLKKALAQGLYKQYHKRNYNNANIKGAIDVSRHINCNVPFQGKVAYRVREHSYDNHITQLVRHTIEFIKQTKGMFGVLHADSDTQKCVNQIIQHTPAYHARSRISVINQNLMPFSHPYFYEYASLQTLCMQILRYEGLRYAKNDYKAHGILFDGAWLWEEYLNTLLRDHGFSHPENKKAQGGIKVYAEKISGNNVSRYPDFVHTDKASGGMVLDAKYKHMLGNSIERHDLNQMISYLYLYKAQKGGFVAPVAGDNAFINIGKLNGFGGQIYKWKLGIPQASSYASFREQFTSNEQKFLHSIKNVII